MTVPLESIKKIYSKLGDELSRTIFENKLLFSLTYNYKFLEEIDAVLFASGENEARRKNLKLKCDSLSASGDGIVIYGAGFFGTFFAYQAENSEIVAFCDSDKTKHNTSHFGKRIISPQELLEKHTNCTVLVAMFSYNTSKNVKLELIESGFPESKITILQEFINFSDNFKSLPGSYFESDIVPPNKNEVFIDAGCFNFATSLDFIKWSGDYKKIIAFEPNPEQYQLCREKAASVRDATVHPLALWHKQDELRFNNTFYAGEGAHISESSTATDIAIKAVTLDSVLQGEEATFIKMDIEGAELNALKGAAETILKHRSRLAISLYHKLEDIWEIPEYILSLHDDYKLFIRHYTNSIWGTLLYAV